MAKMICRDNVTGLRPLVAGGAKVLGGRAVVVVAATFVLAGVTPAIRASSLRPEADLKTARLVLAKHEYGAAARMIEPLAAQGNGRAQLLLAELFERGLGVPKSTAEATRWYEAATLNDDWQDDKLPSEGDLQGPVADGKSDLNAFVKQCRQKAKDGDPEAQARLGWLYESGHGLKPSYKKAFQLYKSAASQGHARALNRLARLYQWGRGVEQNKAKALELYQQAAENGSPEALNNLGYVYVQGDVVPHNYGRAADLFQQAADKGDLNALVNLGWLYQHGKGVPKDYARAAQLYLKASARGLPAALYNLGYLYQEGLGVAQDYKKCAKLYRLAAARPTSQPENVLGLLSEAPPHQVTEKVAGARTLSGSPVADAQGKADM